MLRELHISNLAVISDARIELSGGLNCFTGATGAGKSLVIGAIELLLGLRSGSEMLRPGADEARVSGVFNIRSAHILKLIAEHTDLPLENEGNELLLTRRLFSSGRTSVSLSGHPITLGMLRRVSELLIDIHGQHDQQYLLRPSNQLELLDQFGDLMSLRKAYHTLYLEVSRIRRTIDELAAGRSLRAQQLELYRFQADEIDAAQLDPAAYAELMARGSVLDNLEKLNRDAGATYAALYESDGAVLDRLKMMAAVLSELTLLDATLNGPASGFRDAVISLEEIAFDLSRYLNKLELDPAEKTEIAEQLNSVQRVMSKYGNSIESALAYRQDIGARIDSLSRAADDFQLLKSQLDELVPRLSESGRALSAARRKTADRLVPAVEAQLAELGMEKAKFNISLTQNPAQGAESADGLDEIEFMAQTNPGQLSQPLRKIASGGELGRVMLALKSLLAGTDRISVLVFDEIDANIGGRLGAVIGAKLRMISEHHQVLCITHLPQIASFADRHLTVSKKAEGSTTQTQVRVVTGDERVQELAEMISGQNVSEVTRAQARQLLADAAINAQSKPTLQILPSALSKAARPPGKRQKRTVGS